MIRIADIQREVANLYGLSQDKLCQPDGLGMRERPYVRPRQVAMYLSRRICWNGRQREHCGTSLQAIGRKFGGRDHTTVLHACKQVERFMLADTEERRAVGEIGLRLIERSAGADA